MAPLPVTSAISFLRKRFTSSSAPISPADLAASSLELDALSVSQSKNPSSLSSRSVLHHINARDVVRRATEEIHKKTNSNYNPGAGTKEPGSLNNGAFFGLFALLGAAMVIGALWFFFWSKHGGFKFEDGDWDDYKSTVLRRKGPDGKTLSNATKSTKLGGSSIAGTQHYAWQKQAAKSVVGRDEKGRKGIRAKRGWGKTHSVLYSDDYMHETFGTETTSDMTEVRVEINPADFTNHSNRYRDRDVDHYKKEKPARVGGINRPADGTNYEGTGTESSVSDRSSKPILKSSRADDERAQRRAREEAARMERRWKKDAEEAAAALARESLQAPPPVPAHKKSPNPSKPSTAKRSSGSPRKSTARDFSYQSGPASEVLSTAYTASTSNHTASTSNRTSSSYYDEYRPRSEVPRSSEGRSRQSSPRKQARGARSNGYRRGVDGDLD